MSQQTSVYPSTSVPAARSNVIDGLRRYGWLIFAVVALMIGYLIVWQRGMYYDDYWYRIGPIDPLSQIRTGARLLGSLSGTILLKLMPDNELLLRVILAALVAVNAALLGWLIERLIGSRLAAVSVGLLYLFPVYGSEAALFSTAAAQYLPMGISALLTTHAIVTAFRCQGRAWLWLTLSVIGLAATFNFVEQGAALVFVIPFLALITAVQHPEIPRRTLILRMMVIIFASGIALAGFYVVFYTNNEGVTMMRGSIDLDLAAILQRADQAYFQVFLYFSFLTSSGQNIFQSLIAFSLALPLVYGAVIVLLVSAGFMVIGWTHRSLTGDRTRVAAGLMALTGLIWFWATLLFPSVLAESAALSWRLAYLPTAGLLLMLAGLIALIQSVFRYQWIDRLILTITSMIVIVLIVTMIGLERVYQARNALDNRQFETLVDAVPPALMRNDAALVPLTIDESMVPDYPVLNDLRVGLFDTTVTAINKLRETYGWQEWGVILAYGTPQGAAQFGCTTRELIANGQVCMIGMTDTSPEQVVVDTERIIAFTYRESILFGVASLVFIIDDARVVISLPRVETLRARGVPVLEQLEWSIPVP